MVTPHLPGPGCDAGGLAMPAHPLASSSQPIQPWKPPQALQRLGEPSPPLPNPVPATLPSPEGIVASSTLSPVQVTDRATDSEPVSSRESPLNSMPMLQSSVPEQASIYCQEAPLQCGPAGDFWGQHKADAMDYQQVQQQVQQQVVSMGNGNGVGNKIVTGEIRRSPPTPWKPPAEMKTNNGGFAGNPYADLLDQGPVSEDASRMAMARDQGVMAALDNGTTYENSLHQQQKNGYIGANGDGAGQGVQVQGLGVAVSGQARGLQQQTAYAMPNNAERPLQGLRLSLSSSTQAVPEGMHDNNSSNNSYFARMPESGAYQRDNKPAMWAAAMSISASQWETQTNPDHNAFLNNLRTQIERNQQLSSGRLSSMQQSRASFPAQDFGQERNPAMEMQADRAQMGRSYVNPAPAPQFLHSAAPNESYTSQVNRLVGLPSFQNNFNAPVFANYEQQRFPPTNRPAYNRHIAYNGVNGVHDNWERIQSVGSFQASRHRNNHVMQAQEQQQQQFAKFEGNGVPALDYKQAADALTWARDSGLGAEQFLDVAPQQAGNGDFGRSCLGPGHRPPQLSADQLVNGSGRALISRGDGNMVQKQQHWMGADRNGWSTRPSNDVVDSRSNPDSFGHHGGGGAGGGTMELLHLHQSSVAPDNHVMDTGSLLATGGRLYTDSLQNQSLPLLQQGQEHNTLHRFHPIQSEVAPRFPIPSNCSDLIPLRAHSDGRVRESRLLMGKDQGRGYRVNSENQIIQVRVYPERGETRDALQEGEPAPPTPEKCDIVDGMELKCPHGGDFEPSKQEAHDATIASLSDITCANLVQPSSAVSGEQGTNVFPEQSSLPCLDSPPVHLKSSSQNAENALTMKPGRAHARPEGSDDGASAPSKRRKVGENGDVQPDSGFPADAAPKAGYPLALDMLVDAVQVASGSMQEKNTAEPENAVHTSTQKQDHPLHEGVHVVRKKVLRRAKNIFKRQSSFGAESNGSTNEVGIGEYYMFNTDSSVLSGTRDVDRDAERSTDDGRASKESDAAPLIRSKRGRAQQLPSRLRDSVMEPLKKGAPVVKGFKRDHSEDPDSGSGMYDNPPKKLREGLEDKGTLGAYHVKEEYGTPLGKGDSAQGNSQDWSPKALKDSEGAARAAQWLKHKSSPLSDVEVTWDSAARSSGAAVAGSSKHELAEFDVGDVVWARSGKKNDPVWPAKVVDPIKEVPDSVRRLCVPGRLCVMFFGKSLAKKKERDYAWVREGMIYPFMDYLDRFQGQTNFNRYRPMDFIVAINEATLADAGYDCYQGVPGKCHPSVSPVVSQRETVEGQETEDIVSDTEKSAKKPAGKKPASTSNTSKSVCVGCDAKLSVKAAPKTKNAGVEDNPLCKHCVKLYRSRQYCGVCKKVWQPNEKGNWVQCDVCNIWVHADCDKISNKSLKELEKGSYKCPECRKMQTPRKKTLAGRAGMEASPYDVPDTIAVVCSEMVADYLPKIHQISCKCKQCGNSGKLMKPSEWERHTGCRKKKWKESIRMRYLDQTLLSWIQRLMQGGAIGLAYAGPEIRVPPKMRAQQLAASLELPYEPVRATFTTERCGVCRWVEDYDYNKMIICNRCQIAVHQECYGVQHSDKSGPWVCRACETPEIERECCLCPVKGGAMKPTSVSGYWVHVTCAWFIREVTFKSAAKMEPAEGITNIDLALFRQACVICRQVHGAVIQCCGSKCRKVYHTMCAFNAGYYMEINSYNDRNGVGVTRMISYCSVHRTPNPEGRLQLTSPEGKVAEKRDITYSRGAASVVGILSGSNLTRKLDAKFEKSNGETSSSARCRPYDAQDKHKKSQRRRGEAIAYRVTGISWHSAEDINALRDYVEPGLTIKERLASLPEMEKNRVCFGKSAIHGWGLFARRAIKEGEMVLEYRGERVRGSVADLREEHYRIQGKDCYLFKVNEDEVIDATDKGNLGRLINHSCDPSCYSKIFEEVDENAEIRSRVVLMARKDVKAGEELTYDYRFDPEDKKVECLCGAANCRQFMN